MADYYVDQFGNVTNKNKKKKKSDYVVDYSGKVTKTSSENVAPVKKTTGNSSGDIAPVTKNQKDSYFQKGALSEGFSLKNLMDANKATKADMTEDATVGILGLAERVWDGLVQYSAANAYYVAESYNKTGDKTLSEMNARIYEQSKKEAAEYVAKDIIKEEEIARKIITEPFQNKTGINVEQASYLGSKGDALVQSASDQLVRSGLHFVPVVGTALATGVTGLSVLGGEAENAYKNGATYEEALISGMTSATGEMASEALFGGIKLGGKTVTDAFIKNVAQKAPSKFLGTLAKWGFNTAGEGAEEIISGYITALGQHLTYMDEKEINELFTKEDAWESFVAGSILGGVFETGNLAASKAKGVDYLTGNTNNEQKVIDKVVEKRIAEQEADGTKLNKKEKAKIEEAVKRDLEKGYIDIDTIESVLGGETYEGYKSLNEKEKALQDEIRALESDPKPVAQRRVEAAKAELEKIRNGTEKTELKNRLSEEVKSLAMSDRLAESYNEKVRKTQAFNADLTRYDEKMQTTVKKAVESGILNNSNRTHEFVDMIAKLSADKGVSFDFTDNENLKKSGFALDGKIINGLVKGNDVILNVDSHKALNSVVGHEITHVLEGTELYAELQTAIKEYATTKGEYDARLKEITVLYEGVDGANVEAELMADLVGDYLFTDSDFISKLSTEKPNVFKRIYDEIKYFLKIATAGSKEARQLEQVKRAFDKAYKEATTNTEANDVNFSLVGKENGVEVYETSNTTKELSYKERKQKLLDTMKNEFAGRTAKFTKNGEVYYAFYDKDGLNKGVYGDKKSDKKGYKAKINIGADGNYIELAENALYVDSSKESGKTNRFHKDAKEWDYYVKTVKSDGVYYDVLVNVKNTGDNQFVYDITLKETGSLPEQLSSYDGSSPVSTTSVPQIQESATENAKNATENADIRYSMSTQEQNIAPTGKYNVYGKDVRLQKDVAPMPEIAESAGQLFSISEDVQNDVAPTAEHEAIAPAPESAEIGPRMTRVKDAPADGQNIAPVAQIMTEEPKAEKKKSRFWSQAMELVGDKGFVFENLSKKTKNRELEAKWNFIRYADGKAQDFIGNGADGVKSLKDVQSDVEKAGLTKPLYEYVYHLHNIDRMSLENRYDDVQNKAVFGDSVTADISKREVAKLEAQYPALKKYAQEIYNINDYLRDLLVEGGVISQETADLWKEMYPHYVPIRRAGDHGLNINVPLDTGRTGINAPVKKATGGSSDILPLFDTMAQRALQTYKAVAKNRFGVELKNTLNSTVGAETAGVDNVIDSLDNSEELLQKGKNGKNPTFTVFENGEKVTFEITDDMYDALKPTSEPLKYTNKVANTVSNIHRGVLTEYNPAFLASNAIKDVQDVLINSQHPARTYATFPKAMFEMARNGKMYQEYIKNGGERNTYFDSYENSFVKEKSGLSKALGIPFELISKANNFVEKMPRLAEYIASREAGRSIEVSMLDSARVTTNFAAGGDLTKFANRNGATFLNASVQGAMQQVRNVREAKMNGLKGWTQLATKYAIAGLPAILLNGLLWDDDEEYEELSDYVKENYYVVAKYGDGKFVRIPKGRTLAVIQNAFELTMNALTGNDEVDLKNFLQLAVSNLAPNNPIENNIIAPIIQAKNNEAWYGGDLVPTRLQDLPAEEQFDESTDSISRWLGEKLKMSPYKINYLLDQYTGGLGDIALPMLTPEAENGEDTLLGNITAPIRDKFTTDSVLNNQNVSDFYDTSDELTVNAKRSGATDEDVIANKYFNSVKTDIGKLYAEKREIQNSDMSDSEKYYLVRGIQKQINALAQEALSEHKNVDINGIYSTVGDRQYRRTDEGWQKLSTDEIEKQDKVTSSLGITPSEYWSNKEEYNYAYEEPGKYAIAKTVGGYDSYKTYSKALNDIRADKDSSGKTINGSAKEKKLNYINNLNIDYGQKLLLIRSEFTSQKDKDAYNADIVDYLYSRYDLTNEERIKILEELDMTVHADGYISW